MSSFLERYGPRILVMVVFWGLMIWLVFQSVQQCDGNLIYPLDDTYIHMAIAQNTALHQVWGISKHAFSSTTSSPLWTFLLALVYMVFGVNEWTPLLLNIFFATLLIMAAGNFLDRMVAAQSMEGKRKGYLFVILLTALLVSPLPSLTMIGIEHVLHTLLTLFFLGFAVRVLSVSPVEYLPKPFFPLRFKPAGNSVTQIRTGNSENGNPDTTGSHAFLFLLFLAPFLTMSRYEGLFLVFSVCVLMLFQRKWTGAVITGTAALLPVIGYGFWSVSRGWFFLPNSLLLKGQMPDHGLRELIGMIHRTLIEVQSNPHILVLLVVSLVMVLLHRHRLFDIRLYYAHLIYSCTLLLHMTFASTGWLFRYEAYLVFVGILIAGASAVLLVSKWFPGIAEEANDSGRSKINASGSQHSDPFGRTAGRFIHLVAVLLLACIAAFPFVQRAYYSYILTPGASGNIYEQHYHMGQFLNTYYQGEAVAVNDIGAVSWLADIRLFDLWGLGSFEPTALRRKGIYTTAEIDRLTKEYGVVMAIVYDDWFDGENMAALPPEWKRAGQWRIDGNVIAGSDVVTFYAVKPGHKSELKRNLIHFSDMLPSGVTQSGLLPDQ